MSQKQINTVTLAALAEWANTRTKASFKTWLLSMKSGGRYWGADETLEDAPNA